MANSFAALQALPSHCFPQDWQQQGVYILVSFHCLSVALRSGRHQLHFDSISISIYARVTPPFAGVCFAAECPTWVLLQQRPGEGLLSSNRDSVEANFHLVSWAGFDVAGSACGGSCGLVHAREIQSLHKHHGVPLPLWAGCLAATSGYLHSAADWLAPRRCRCSCMLPLVSLICAAADCTSQIATIDIHLYSIPLCNIQPYTLSIYADAITVYS